MNSQQHTCDVLVVGAGPAGIAAASLAAEAGKTVAVIDNSPWLGGQIWRGEQAHPAQSGAQRWLARLQKSGARVFSSATVFGISGTGAVLAETPTTVLEFAWQRLITATGAREVFLPFPGWTLPGVVGPGGLHALVKGGWPVRGKRIIVAGSGPLLLAAADGLSQQGAQVLLIAEQAPWPKVASFGLSLLRFPRKLAQGLALKTTLARVPYRCGCWPVKAEGANHVQHVTLTNAKRTWTEHCDYLACAFHLVPNLELPMLLGCAITDGSVKVTPFQETSIRHVFCAGESTGVGGAECALMEGQIAGLAAAGRADQARALFGSRARWHRFRAAMNRAFELRPELMRLPAGETIICRCEDVGHAELSGFDNWHAAKLQTRCGMGPCQGRICGTAAHVLFGWEFTSVRPPIFPVKIAALLATGTSPSPDHNPR